MGGAIKKPGVLYSDVKNDIRPFDLVLFAGNDFISKLIKLMEKGFAPPRMPPLIDEHTYSHAGMIVTSDILDHPNVKPEKLYVLESTISGKLGYGVKNVDNESFLGVQLRDFDELMEAYDTPGDTRIAIAKLIINPATDNTPRQKDSLKEKFTGLYNKLQGTYYQINPLNLSAALCKCMRPLAPRSDWMFCSELVAEVYKNFDVLPSTVKPENVLPMDFLGYDSDDVKDGGVPMVVETPIKVTTAKHL